VNVNNATTKNTLNKLLTLSDPRGGVLAVTDPRDRLPPGEFSLGVIPGGCFLGVISAHRRVYVCSHRDDIQQYSVRTCTGSISSDKIRLTIIRLRCQSLPNEIISQQI